MVFPELMRDAVVSKGDHQILLAAKYMQEVKYKSDSRVRVVGLRLPHLGNTILSDVLHGPRWQIMGFVRSLCNMSPVRVSQPGCCALQVVLTDDVNLRSIAAGEGIMAVSGPAELPKKRKEFLPKMFPSLPEDSAVSHTLASSVSPHRCAPWEHPMPHYRTHALLVHARAEQ